MPDREHTVDHRAFALDAHRSTVLGARQQELGASERAAITAWGIASMCRSATGARSAPESRPQGLVSACDPASKASGSAYHTS